MTDRSTRWTKLLAHALAPADDAPRDVMGSILLNLAVFVAYSISGLVVLVFGIGPAKISPIYPPAGIAVAASFIFGPRVLRQSFLASSKRFPAAGGASDDAGEVRPRQHRRRCRSNAGSVDIGRLAAATCRHVASVRAPRDVVIFLVGSCIVAALVGGMVGTLSLWAVGIVPTEQLQITFVTYFLADAAGIAVFGSLILAWYREPRPDANILTISLVITSVAILIAASKHGPATRSAFSSCHCFFGPDSGRVPAPSRWPRRRSSSSPFSRPPT